MRDGEHMALLQSGCWCRTGWKRCCPDTQELCSQCAVVQGRALRLPSCSSCLICLALSADSATTMEGIEGIVTMYQDFMKKAGGCFGSAATAVGMHF